MKRSTRRACFGMKMMGRRICRRHGIGWDGGCWRDDGGSSLRPLRGDDPRCTQRGPGAKGPLPRERQEGA